MKRLFGQDGDDCGGRQSSPDSGVFQNSFCPSPNSSRRVNDEDWNGKRPDPQASQLIVKNKVVRDSTAETSPPFLVIGDAVQRDQGKLDQRRISSGRRRTTPADSEKFICRAQRSCAIRMRSSVKKRADQPKRNNRAENVTFFIFITFRSLAVIECTQCTVSHYFSETFSLQRNW